MPIAMLGITGAAYAQQSSPGVATQPALPTSTATVPSATTTSATPAPSTASQGQQMNNNRPSTDVIKEARRAGYVMKTKSGNYLFCKTDSDVGTRLATEKCVDADALALTLHRQQMDKDGIRSQSQGLSGGH